jgi:hypothetical protein
LKPRIDPVHGILEWLVWTQVVEGAADVNAFWLEVAQVERNSTLENHDLLLFICGCGQAARAQALIYDGRARCAPPVRSTLCHDSAGLVAEALRQLTDGKAQDTHASVGVPTAACVRPQEIDVLSGQLRPANLK